MGPSFNVCLCIAIWFKILSWTHLIKKLFNFHNQIHFELNELWIKYHNCASEFQTFCIRYQNLPLVELREHQLISKHYVFNVQQALENVLVHNLPLLVLDYVHDIQQEIIFDNWMEEPYKKEKIRIYIYHNEQILSFLIENSDPKRRDLKKKLESEKHSLTKYFFIPDETHV